jgi:hypothetical protein
VSEYREKPDMSRADAERIWDGIRKKTQEEVSKAVAAALETERQAVAERVIAWFRENPPLAGGRRLTAAQEMALRKRLAAGPAPDAPTPD